MSQNLLSFLQGQLSADAIAQVSTFLGETTTETSAATAAALQAVFAAMTQKAATPHGSNDLVAMVTRVTGDGSLSQLAGLLTGGSALTDVTRLGTPLAAALLGSHRSGVVDWLSSTSGVGRGSASSLLAMLTPLALSGLSKYLTSTGSGVNASAIANVLDAQAAPVLATLPAALAAALGVPGQHRAAHTDTRKTTPGSAAQDAGLSFLRWLMPLLALAALLAYVLNRPPGLDTSATAAVDTAARPRVDRGGVAAAATGTARDSLASLGPVVERRLPGAPSIRVPEYGIESTLLAFITDNARTVDTTTWFSFDRLEFDTASATLRPTSDPQLDAMASILKAYPTVALKIGGYTDNVGDDTANQKLSAARAEHTKAALVARGVESSRLDAEGYGEQFPVASNDTESGRQRNRRIDVRVLRK